MENSFSTFCWYAAVDTSICRAFFLGEGGVAHIWLEADWTANGTGFILLALDVASEAEMDNQNLS